MGKKEKQELTEKEQKEQLRKYAGAVNEETIGAVIGQERKLKGFFRHVTVLQKYWKDACEVFAMLRDWVSGRYRDVPWRVIAALVGALVYVMSPLDVIPDFIPGVGYVDDAGVFAAALAFAKPDLAKYRAWKRTRRREEKTEESTWSRLEENE